MLAALSLKFTNYLMIMTLKESKRLPCSKRMERHILLDLIVVGMILNQEDI